MKKPEEQIGTSGECRAIRKLIMFFRFLLGLLIYMQFGLFLFLTGKLVKGLSWVRIM